jgi:energy-converting hydrogenase Eha subunit B
MPGCLTSTTVNIPPFVNTLRRLQFFSLLVFLGMSVYEVRDPGGAGLLPPLCFTSNVHLTVFVMIDAYLCSASAVIFLAPISAFDQVSQSMRMV